MLNMPTPAELAAMAAQQPQPLGLHVSSPFNDIQLVVLAATNIFKASAGTAAPKSAVELARQIFVEAVVAESRTHLRDEIDQRLNPSRTEATKAGEQFVIPGTR